MPFSTLADPVDFARAEGALDAAWRKIEPEITAIEREEARAHLARLVANYAMVALDEEDLAIRALERFKGGGTKP